MKNGLRSTLAVLTLTLTACGTLPTAEAPVAPVSHNNAVIALVDKARTDNTNGHPDAAAATLERALRMEPRNPGLWYELARTRLQQGQAAQAISLAAKSNAWSGDNKTLRAANWRLIGEARAQLGDTAGAQTALDTAAQLER